MSPRFCGTDDTWFTDSCAAGSEEVCGEVSRLNQRDLSSFKDLLNSRRLELLGEAGRTVSGMVDGKENFPEPADRAALESDRNATLRIRDRERKLISKIEEALQRIEDGVFGESAAKPSASNACAPAPSPPSASSAKPTRRRRSALAARVMRCVPCETLLPVARCSAAFFLTQRAQRPQRFAEGGALDRPGAVALVRMCWDVRRHRAGPTPLSAVLCDLRVLCVKKKAAEQRATGEERVTWSPRASPPAAAPAPAWR